MCGNWHDLFFSAVVIAIDNGFGDVVRHFLSAESSVGVFIAVSAVFHSLVGICLCISEGFGKILGGIGFEEIGIFSLFESHDFGGMGFVVGTDHGNTVSHAVNCVEPDLAGADGDVSLIVVRGDVGLFPHYAKEFDSISVGGFLDDSLSFGAVGSVSDEDEVRIKIIFIHCQEIALGEKRHFLRRDHSADDDDFVSFWGVGFDELRYFLCFNGVPSGEKFLWGDTKLDERIFSLRIVEDGGVGPVCVLGIEAFDSTFGSDSLTPEGDRCAALSSHFPCNKVDDGTGIEFKDRGVRFDFLQDFEDLGLDYDFDVVAECDVVKHSDFESFWIFETIEGALFCFSPVGIDYFEIGVFGESLESCEPIWGQDWLLNKDADFFVRHGSIRQLVAATLLVI